MLSLTLSKSGLLINKTNLKRFTMFKFNLYLSKYIVLGSVFSFALHSCNNKKEKQPNEIEIPKDTIQQVEVEKPTEEIIHEKPKVFVALENWKNYYDKRIKGFDLKDFKKDESHSFEREHSHIEPIWSDNFNPIHKQFLVYNSDSTIYIDFDSYKWGLNEKNQLMIEPDQEVTLVNIAEKKIERLLFYGPSYWVEDAYFKNDSTLVLLENSTDQTPAYQEVNLNTNTGQYFTYKKSTGFDSDYYKDRVLSIYKKKP